MRYSLHINCTKGIVRSDGLCSFADEQKELLAYNLTSEQLKQLAIKTTAEINTFLREYDDYYLLVIVNSDGTFVVYNDAHGSNEILIKETPEGYFIRSQTEHPGFTRG